MWVSNIKSRCCKSTLSVLGFFRAFRLTRKLISNNFAACKTDGRGKKCLPHIPTVQNSEMTRNASNTETGRGPTNCPTWVSRASDSSLVYSLTARVSPPVLPELLSDAQKECSFYWAAAVLLRRFLSHSPSLLAHFLLCLQAPIKANPLRHYRWASINH